jgi:hypothetical protein
MAAQSAPTIEVSAAGDHYETKRTVVFKNTEAAFHPGQEVEYQRLNGTKVTFVFMVEDVKLSERQRSGEVTVTATWPFSYPALTNFQRASLEGVAGTEVYKRLL